MVFDELDHLGAYISNNRFDQTMKDQLKKFDKLFWDSFSDKVDRHFENDNWETAPVPEQFYPRELSNLLDVLAHSRPAGWLKIDSHIRDLDDDGRRNLAEVIRDLLPTLKRHPVRRFLFGDERALQIWLLACSATHPTAAEIRHEGEVACLVTNQMSVPVLILKYSSDRLMQDAECTMVKSPPIIRSDYGALIEEAARKRRKFVRVGKKSKP
jgi:hypothetical protein